MAAPDERRVDPGHVMLTLSASGRNTLLAPVVDWTPPTGTIPSTAAALPRKEKEASPFEWTLSDRFHLAPSSLSTTPTVPLPNPPMSSRLAKRAEQQFLKVCHSRLSTLSNDVNGVVARRTIAPYTLLGEYRGDRRPSSEIDTIETNDYLLRVSDRETIDASPSRVPLARSSIVRYINECRPDNIVRGEARGPNVVFLSVVHPPSSFPHMYLVSGCEPIAAGDELLVDYGPAWCPPAPTTSSTQTSSTSSGAVVPRADPMSTPILSGGASLGPSTPSVMAPEPVDRKT